MPDATYELLDPEQITVRNIRDAKPSQQLIDSIREYGVLQPIGVFRTPGGELILRFGDRRRKACIEAGLPVPAIVVNGTAGTTEAEISRIFEQLDENDNREDLTAGDRAGAVAELFEYGADERTVSRRTGYGKAEIAAARKAATSETARTLAAQYPLDMTQLSVIAEFDDAPQVAAKLARTAADDPGQFAHQVEQARQARTDAAMVAARAAELTPLGVTVLPEDLPGYDNTLSNWTGPDGEQLTPETHRGCPGNAVYLRPWGYAERQVSESWYCTDPRGNGHRKRRSNGGEPELSAEEATAERRRVREGNDAWRAATTVRQRWLRDVLLSQKSMPEGGALFIVRALAAADQVYLALSTMAGGRHKTARELLGGINKDVDHYKPEEVKRPLLDTLTGISEQRAQMITFNLIVGAYEDQAADVDTWKTQPRSAREYLSALKSWGYTLSPIEQGVIEADRG